MAKHWKTIVLLAVVAAVSATLGGVLSAVRNSNPTSADEVDVSNAGAPDSDVRPAPASRPDTNRDDASDAADEETSPFAALFGSGGDKGGRRPGGREARPPKPGFEAEFKIAEGTERIEFASASTGLPTHGEWRGRPAIGDIDRDGNLDFVCSVRKGDGLHVFYGDGAGSWTEKPTPFNKNLGYGGSDLGDFNRDGFLDIVFATHGAPAQMFVGDGNGGWTRASEGSANPQILQDVCVADFDNNGNDDIIAIGWAHGGVVLFVGDGKGTWETRDVFPGDDEQFGHEVLTGDIDADGHVDFVVTMGGPKVFLGDGKFGFKPAHRALPVPLTKGTNFGIALGDVTGDGTLELAVCFTAMEGMRGIAVYDQGEDGSWASISKGLPLDTTFSDAEFADLDGDGKLDLIGYCEDNLLIWRGDGGKSWTPAGHFGDLGRSGDLAVGDLNGDGRTDILVVHRHGNSGVKALLNR